MKKTIIVAGLFAGFTVCAGSQPIIGPGATPCAYVNCTAQSLNVLGSIAPSNGAYLPSANTLGLVGATTVRIFSGASDILDITSSGAAATNYSTSGRYTWAGAGNGQASGQTTSSTGTGYILNAITNTGGAINYGVESNGGGSIFVGSPAYAADFGTVNATSLCLGTNTNCRETISSVGDVKWSGTIPVVTGTGTPTIATGSTDTSGEVTSGSTATSIVITFSSTKTNAPFCTVTPQTQLLAFAYTISTTAITITQTATTGELIDYVCFQH